MSRTMLYRPAEVPNPSAWHLPVETGIFLDHEVPHALESGWFLHPTDFPADEPEAEQPKRRGRPPKEG